MCDLRNALIFFNSENNGCSPDLFQTHIILYYYFTELKENTDIAIFTFHIEQLYSDFWDFFFWDADSNILSSSVYWN